MVHFRSCVSLAAALVLAAIPADTAVCDHRGWPRTPPDYVREMGASGVWQSVTTWKNGTRTRAFWHLVHDVKANEVDLGPPK